MWIGFLVVLYLGPRRVEPGLNRPCFGSIPLSLLTRSVYHVLSMSLSWPYSRITPIHTARAVNQSYLSAMYMLSPLLWDTRAVLKYSRELRVSLGRRRHCTGCLSKETHANVSPSHSLALCQRSMYEMRSPHADPPQARYLATCFRTSQRSMSHDDTNILYKIRCCTSF